MSKTNIGILTDNCSDAAQFYQRQDVALTTAVDSLKVRIPAECVQINSAELQNSKWLTVNSETGRIRNISGINSTEYTYPTDDVIVYKNERQNLGGRRPEQFVSVQLTSKMLGGEYLTGINSRTIHKIYSEIQRHGIIDVDALSFFDKTACSDVDLKRDRVLPADQFRAQIKDLKSAVKLNKRHLVDTNAKRDNLGVQLSKRETKSFKTAPFLKLYHKGVELLHNSKVFAAHHLGEVSYQDLVREETTIKNRKHLRYLYGDDFEANLGNVVSLSADQQAAAFQHARSCYFDSERIQARRQASAQGHLKGIDKILFAFLRNYLQSGKTIDEAVQMAVLDMYSGSDQVARNSRTKYKRKLHELYDLIQAENGSEYCPVLDLFLEVQKRA